MKIIWLIEASITKVREVYHGLFDQHGRPINTDGQANENQNKVIPPSLSPLDKAEGASRQKSPAHNWHDTYKDPQVFFTMLAFIIGAIACVIYYFQLDATRGQLNAMQGQIATMTNQTVVMQDQVGEMKRARMLDERAWVITQIENDSGVWQSNTFIITVKFINTGKTPAINVDAIMGFNCDKNNISPLDPKGEITKFALVPNNPRLLTHPIPPQYTFELQSGKAVYVFGTIYYSDIFGREHWTQYCYAVFNKGANITQTDFHNFCDTETETNSSD